MRHRCSECPEQAIAATPPRDDWPTPDIAGIDQALAGTVNFYGNNQPRTPYGIVIVGIADIARSIQSLEADIIEAETQLAHLRGLRADRAALLPVWTTAADQLASPVPD